MFHLQSLHSYPLARSQMYCFKIQSKKQRSKEAICIYTTVCYIFQFLFCEYLSRLETIMFGEILKSSFITLLTLINLITNSGLIAILAKNREIQEDSSTPLLLALNVSDLLHGATFGMISSILSWTGVTDETIPHILKQFHYVSMRFTRLGSLNLVAALAIVKLITIVKPLRAVQLLTKLRVRLMLAASFIVPLPVCVTSILSNLHYSYTLKDTYLYTGTRTLRFIGLLLIANSLILYTVSYLYIFACVVRQVIIMRRLVLPAEGNVPPNPVITALKSSKGIMAVLTVYVVIYIPVLILAYFGVYRESGIYFMLYWLSYGLGFINVFAYVAFSKPARKELKKFWHYVSRRNEIGNLENS